MFFFYNSSNTSSLKVCKAINKQYLGRYLLWILKIFSLCTITVNLVYPLQALLFLTEEIQNENKATSTKTAGTHNRLIKKKLKLTEY